MEAEEDLQVGLPGFVEIAEVESEGAREQQEDHDKHDRQRRREIAAELAAENGPGRTHACASVVMRRNTSSSRPCSMRKSLNATWRWRKRSPTASANFPLPCGNTYRRP